MNKKKKNIKLIISFTTLILFLGLTFIIFSNKILFIDEYISNLLVSIRNKRLNNIMLIITNISSAYALVALTILLVFTIKNKKKALLIVYNLLFVVLTNQVVKLLFQRERPLDIGLIQEDGFSYPSGHSMVSMAYFGFIAYMIYKSTRNKYLKGFTIIGIFLVIFLIGFSRIYLGVHYFSDVIGGFLLAISYLMIFINFNKERIIEVRK